MQDQGSRRSLPAAVLGPQHCSCAVHGAGPGVLKVASVLCTLWVSPQASSEPRARLTAQVDGPPAGRGSPSSLHTLLLQARYWAFVGFLRSSESSSEISQTL